MNDPRAGILSDLDVNSQISAPNNINDDEVGKQIRSQGYTFKSQPDHGRADLHSQPSHIGQNNGHFMPSEQELYVMQHLSPIPNRERLE